MKTLTKEFSQIRMHDSAQVGGKKVSLTNLCAVQTLLQGGKVYLLDEEEMPVKGHIMNALYRY